MLKKRIIEELKIMDHPIDTLMKHTMEELKNMVDVNTIVGTPVTSPDGTIIVPISKVSFAFLSGGSEFGNKTKNNVKIKATGHNLIYDA